MTIFFGFVFFGFYGCNNFSAGSYPYAEVYKVNINADTLIKILTSIKQENSNLIPPSELHLIDGKSDSTDYWYSFYFLNQSKNEIFFTWVRGASREVSNFAFVSVSDGLKLARWKKINKDFTVIENNIKKEQFRNLILNKIKNRLIK